MTLLGLINISLWFLRSVLTNLKGDFGGRIPGPLNGVIKSENFLTSSQKPSFSALTITTEYKILEGRNPYSFVRGPILKI